MKVNKKTIGKIVYLILFFLSFWIVMSHLFIAWTWVELSLSTLFIGPVIWLFLDAFLKRFTSLYLSMYTLGAVLFIWLAVLLVSIDNRQAYNHMNLNLDVMYEDLMLSERVVDIATQSRWNSFQTMIDDDVFQGVAYLQFAEPEYSKGIFQVELVIEDEHYIYRYPVTDQTNLLWRWDLEYEDGHLYLRQDNRFFVFDLQTKTFDRIDMTFSIPEPYITRSFVINNSYVVSMNDRMFIMDDLNITAWKSVGDHQLILDHYEMNEKHLLTIGDLQTDLFSIGILNDEGEIEDWIVQDLVVYPLVYQMNDILYITTDGELVGYSDFIESSRMSFDLGETYERFLVNDDNHNLLASTGYFFKNTMIQSYEDFYIITEVYQGNGFEEMMGYKSYITDKTFQKIYDTVYRGFNLEGRISSGGGLIVFDDRLILKLGYDTFDVTDAKVGKNIFSFPVVKMTANPFFYVSSYALGLIPILLRTEDYHIFDVMHKPKKRKIHQGEEK